MSVTSERGYDGYLLDGRTAAPHPARVAVKGRGLEIVTDDGQARFWSFDAIRQTQGSRSGEPVRIERITGATETLIVRDRSILPALGDHGGRRRIGRQAGRPALLTVAAVAALAAVIAVAVWGIPAASAVLAHWVPEALEDRLGDGVVASIPASMVCRDPGRERLIHGVVDRLAAAAGTVPPAVLVLDSPIPNAFALPGKRIVVFRGLVDFSDSPDMLAGVIAHEIAHVVRRHPMQGVLRRSALSFAVSTLTAGAVSADAAATLTALSYSREMEEEADRDAVAFLRQARVDALGLARFLERVTPANAPAAGGVLRYLSTHPPTRTRAALVRELAAGAASAPGTLLAGDAWDQVRELCLPR